MVFASPSGLFYHIVTNSAHLSGRCRLDNFIVTRNFLLPIGTMQKLMPTLTQTATKPTSGPLAKIRIGFLHEAARTANNCVYLDKIPFRHLLVLCRDTHLVSSKFCFGWLLLLPWQISLPASYSANAHIKNWPPATAVNIFTVPWLIIISSLFVPRFHTRPIFYACPVTLQIPMFILWRKLLLFARAYFCYRHLIIYRDTRLFGPLESIFIYKFSFLTWHIRII